MGQWEDELTVLRKEGYRESQIYDWASQNRESLAGEGFDVKAIDSYVSTYNDRVTNAKLRATKQIDPAEMMQRTFQLLPRETYARLRDAGIWDDEEFDRLMYSVAYNLTPEQTRRMYSQIKELHGGFSPSSVKPIQRGFFGKMAESARRGWSDVATDVAIANAWMNGNDSDLDVFLSNRRKIRLREVIDPINGSLVARAFYGGANIAGGWTRSTLEAADEATLFGATGAAAAATLGQLGPQAALPEEVVTIPSATALGMGYGYAVGSADFWWRQGMGAIIAEGLDLGYDRNVIGPVAAVAALPYALIELAQIGQAIPNAKGMLRNTARGVLKNALKQYGRTWSGEVAEELLQDVVQISAQDLSAILSQETGTFEDPDYLAARAWRLWNTARESAVSMSLLPLPGAMVNVKTGLQETLGNEPLVGDLFDQARQEEQRPEGAPPYSDDQPVPPTDTFTPKFEPELDAAIAELERAIGIEERIEPDVETEVESLSDDDRATLEMLETEAPEAEPAPAAEGKAAETPGRSDFGAVVRPKLHIGNVTKRMRELWAQIFTEAKEGKAQSIEIVTELIGPDPDVYDQILQWYDNYRKAEQIIEAETAEAQERGEKKGLPKAERARIAREVEEREAGPPREATYKAQPKTQRVKPEDIGPFTEKGWRTNRTGIPMTVEEGYELLNHLEERLAEYVAQHEWTMDEVTQMNILWGDITALRQELKLPKGARPYKQKHQKGELVVTIEDIKRRIYDAVKGIGKKTLAEYSYNDLLTEQEALAGAMKKAAQAARKGFVEGKKAGIEKMRLHYRELKAKQRAVRQVKQYRKKLVRQVLRDVPANVDHFYREAIFQLQLQVEPRNRSEKRQQKVDRLARFLRRFPEHVSEIPSDLLKSLAAKPLQEMTTLELESLADERAKLQKTGKHKYTTRTDREKLRNQNTAEKLRTRTAASKPKALPVDPYEFQTTAAGRIRKILKRGLLVSLRPMRLLDMLDGGRGTFKGPWMKFIYDRINKAHQAEDAVIKTRTDAFKAHMKKLDIEFTDFADTIKVGDIDVPIQIAMAVYAHIQNDHGFQALLYGNKFSKHFMKEVIEAVPDTYKAMADWMIEEADENVERLRGTVFDVFNHDMQRETRYSPMVRVDHLGQPIAKNLAEQILQRAGVKRGTVQRGMTIERKDITPDRQTPINVNYVNVWLQQVRSQEHFISHMAVIREINSVLANRKLKEEVVRRFGQDMWKRITNYVDRQANPTTYQAHNWLEQHSRRWRRNVAYAYLAGNLLTIGKQLPSLALYAQDAGMTEMLRSVADFSRKPKQLMDMVKAKDPQVARVSLERELEELRHIAPDEYRRIVDAVGIAGLRGIRFVDSVARTIGWNAVYNRAIAQGMSEPEAIREAQYSTLRTQPAAAVKDVAELYATNEALNWFLMFSNQINQIFNIVTYDIPAYWANADYQKVAAAGMGVAISQALIWSIAARRLPEDEDDWRDLCFEQSLNIVPLLGRFMVSGMQGWDTDIPPFEAAKNVGRVVTAKNKERAAMKALESIAALNGIPVIAIKRAKRFAEETEPLELIGGEPRR